MSNERNEYVSYTRNEITEMVKFAAKMRLIGSMYVGNIGKQTVRWNDTNDTVEVITTHTPCELPKAS